MQVHAHAEDRLLIARVEGRFDAHGIERFTSHVVERVNADTPNVTIDLSSVEFMDSSALAGLVKTLKRTMEHAGSIVLIAPSDPARIILELTRLDEVFPTAASLVEARAQLLADA